MDRGRTTISKPNFYAIAESRVPYTIYDGFDCESRVGVAEVVDGKIADLQVVTPKQLNRLPKERVVRFREAGDKETILCTEALKAAWPGVFHYHYLRLDIAANYLDIGYDSNDLADCAKAIAEIILRAYLVCETDWMSFREHCRPNSEYSIDRAAAVEDDDAWTEHMEREIEQVDARSRPVDLVAKLEKLLALNSLSGETVVFSGGIYGFLKSDLEKLAARCGAVILRNFTSKTTMLVNGLHPSGEKTTKRNKAEAAISKGQPFRIVDQATFMEIIIPSVYGKGGKS